MYIINCSVIFALIFLIITGEYNNWPYTKSVNPTCAVNSSFGGCNHPSRHGYSLYFLVGTRVVYSTVGGRLPI